MEMEFRTKEEFLLTVAAECPVYGWGVADFRFSEIIYESGWAEYVEKIYGVQDSSWLEDEWDDSPDRESETEEETERSYKEFEKQRPALEKKWEKALEKCQDDMVELCQLLGKEWREKGTVI